MLGIHLHNFPTIPLVESRQTLIPHQGMGKSKRQKRNLSLRVPYTKDARNKKPQALTSSPPTSKTSKTPQQAPTIPFDPQDRILLVGEGDFSFTLSLYTHHNCTSLIATCYDNAATLAEKYPQSGAHIRKLEDAPRDVGEQRDIKVLYGVDATKLGKCGAAGGGKVVRKGGFDRVMFNFPHVGGVTKDVNRQVRYNQGT